jgi:hypothetical protein
VVNAVDSLIHFQLEAKASDLEKIFYGYFFMDNFSVNIDALVSYIHSGIDDNGNEPPVWR